MFIPRDLIRKHIESNGTDFLGKAEYVDYLAGKPLTADQAILAKCYDCRFYSDNSPVDCETPTCPLYGFMPFRGIAKGAECADKKEETP